MPGVRIITFSILLTLGGAAPAGAQTMTEVLTFLLTNRSVATDNFAGDAQAAAATRDAIRRFLLAELATRPLASPASGFTYRLDPSIGTSVRTSDSFGPFFTERSLTSGRGWYAIGVHVDEARFDKIDGRSLRDGTLVATASRLVGDTLPFDVETLTLRLRMQTVTVSGLAGVTDRLDISAAVPFSRLDLEGERVDIYRGQVLTQAAGDGYSLGLGDIVVRAKYNVLRRDAGGGVSIAGDLRFGTGSGQNLLGGDETTLTPRVIASAENGPVAVHGNAGFQIGGVSRNLDFQGALSVAPSPRLTLIAEIVGRRLEAGGRLLDTVAAHPTMLGIETIRLTASVEWTTRLDAVAGLRWNFAGPWVLSANVMRPLTSRGLTARWVPAFSLDYSVGR
jgi:hypothetical protein